MENGGFNNIQTLHMNEGDTARNKNLCSFIIGNINDFGYSEDKCRITNEKCISSSHCQYYTTSAAKALERFDVIYCGKDSKKCEYIELDGKLPTCTQDFPHLICFGNGHKSCIKNSKNNSPTYNYNIQENIIDYLDTVTIERKDNSTVYRTIFKKLPVNPNNKIVSILIGKKIGDEIEYQNYDWKIVRIVKSNKQDAFVVHKKENKTAIEKKIICKICKKEILAKNLIMHLKKEHPKNKEKSNFTDERKLMNKIMTRFGK